MFPPCHVSAPLWADRIFHPIGSREKDRALTRSGSSQVPKEELGLAEYIFRSHVDRHHTNILTNCECVFCIVTGRGQSKEVQS